MRVRISTASGSERGFTLSHARYRSRYWSSEPSRTRNRKSI